jgi:hypothetical protein
MMKSKFIYLLLMLVGVLACSDDFTESTAFGALSDDALANPEGVELLLVGAYSLLDGNTDTGGADWEKTADGWWYDAISDDAHKGSTNGDQADLFLLETFDWNTANPYIGNKWRSLYASVNRANAVLSLIRKVSEDSPDVDFTRQEAEARFLRAHYNFEIQKGWGNVPFISLDNYDATEFNQPNTGPIWDQIESDMKFAVDNLGADSELGRPNTFTAHAYLGKIHLYQGEYAEALTYLDPVIAGGPYSLLTEFVDNFRLAGETGSESIFAIQFTADAGLSFNGNRGGTLSFPNGGPISSCCGFYQPTQDLVNAFQTDGNGLPLLDTYNNSDVANDFGIESAEPFTPHTGPLDPRLDYTVGRRGLDMNGWGVNVGKDWIRASFGDISGPYLTKKNYYHAGEDANRGTGGWGEQRSGINYHIIRYADVLLMAAEAAIEVGRTDDALTWVNQVRNRAKNMTYLKDVNDPSKDAANYEIEPYPAGAFGDVAYARKAVRFERRLELGVEGHRLFDLRRWDANDAGYDAVQVMNDYIANEGRTITPFGTAANPYEAKYNLFPIPLGAIDLSGGVLQQNPGY